MLKKIFDILLKPQQAPNVDALGYAKGIGFFTFLISVFFTMTALAAFNKGGWVLLCIGAFLIGGLLCLAAYKNAASALAYCGGYIAKTMIGGAAIVLGIATVVLIAKAAFDVSEDHATSAAIKREAIFQTSPEKLVESLIGNSDIHAVFTKAGDKITITYDLKPWALTAFSTTSSFNLHVTKLIPAFFGRYADVQEIEVVGEGTFNDKRGNSSRGVGVRIMFLRKNTSGINWNNVNYADIPEIADSYWIHPSINP